MDFFSKCGRPKDEREIAISLYRRVGVVATVETPRQETLEHSRNCGVMGFDGYDRGECTCGLDWRIKLRTEQEMHAAWRKRAEEAEAKLAGETPQPASEPTEEQEHSGI